jgi:hypothetical protein
MVAHTQDSVAEAGRSQIRGQPGTHAKTLSQKDKKKCCPIPERYLDNLHLFLTEVF